MSSILGKDDSENLVLIAVVKWETTSEESKANHTTKVRVRQQDLQGYSCTGQELSRIILAQVGANVGVRSPQHDANVKLEIYDSRQSTYISLLHPDFLNTDICKILGSRLHVQISIDNGLTDLKTIKGRFYPYNSSEGITVSGYKIVVDEISNKHNASTGVNVWDGAMFLSAFLENQPQVVQSKRVLELGAGCGLVGIVAGVLGAKEVILTDLPSIVPLLQTNLNRHKKLLKEAGCQQIECTTCDWYNPQDMRELGRAMKNRDWKPDVILVADCIWMKELVKPLLATIELYTQSEPGPTIYVSYQRRGKSTHEELWEGLHSLFPQAHEIDVSALGLAKTDVLHLIKCRR